jgi:hypothetical protein
MLRFFTIINAIFVALGTELIVLGVAAIIANDTEMFWEYAARYSARISFVILAGLLLYMAIQGLSSINDNESKKKILMVLIYFFWTNHIIHFIYLAANQGARNRILIKRANILGMIVYVLVLLLPLFLNRGLLSRGKQTMLLVSLLLISVFFILLYIAHLVRFIPSPDASAAWLYTLFASVLALLVLANVYRHISDSRAVRLTPP